MLKSSLIEDKYKLDTTSLTLTLPPTPTGSPSNQISSITPSHNSQNLSPKLFKTSPTNTVPSIRKITSPTSLIALQQLTRFQDINDPVAYASFLSLINYGSLSSAQLQQFKDTIVKIKLDNQLPSHQLNELINQLEIAKIKLSTNTTDVITAISTVISQINTTTPKSAIKKR